MHIYIYICSARFLFGGLLTSSVLLQTSGANEVCNSSPEEVSSKEASVLLTQFTEQEPGNLGVQPEQILII